jgi:hypothetical protein
MRNLWHDFVVQTGVRFMACGAVRTLTRILCVILIACTIALAECPVDTVIVKGRVEHAPSNAKVRVLLIYTKEIPGESAEASLENGTFTIPIEFLTLGRHSTIRNLPEKCDRKPIAVNITLMGGDHDYDPVSLYFAKDFKVADPSAYILRSELVLNGSQ